MLSTYKTYQEKANGIRKRLADAKETAGRLNDQLRAQEIASARAKAAEDMKALRQEYTEATLLNLCRTRIGRLSVPI